MVTNTNCDESKGTNKINSEMVIQSEFKSIQMECQQLVGKSRSDDGDVSCSYK